MWIRIASYPTDYEPDPLGTLGRIRPPDDGIPVGEDGVIVVDVQLLHIRVPVQIFGYIP